MYGRTGENGEKVIYKKCKIFHEWKWKSLVRIMTSVYCSVFGFCLEFIFLSFRIFPVHPAIPLQSVIHPSIYSSIHSFIFELLSRKHIDLNGNFIIHTIIKVSLVSSIVDARAHTTMKMRPRRHSDGCNNMINFCHPLVQ